MADSMSRRYPTDDGVGESTSLMSTNTQHQRIKEAYGIPTDGDVLLEPNAGGHFSDDALSDSTSSSAMQEIHGTTPLEAFTNLMKGYIGAGMLRQVEKFRTLPLIKPSPASQMFAAFQPPLGFESARTLLWVLFHFSHVALD